MPIVADAAVAVRGDLTPFKKDLAGADKQVQTLGSRLKGALTPSGLLAGAGIAFGGAQVLSFLSDATNAAAEFQDSVAASGVIFGEEAIPQMEAWGEAAAENFGASKQEALAAANVIATLGKSAGLAGDDLVGFSQEMVQLGGDLASMFGGTTQDAITAVGAALRGESEPIRRYGVLLDDATLRQQAFEMGLISTTKNALTPQQRVLAAHAEIMEQTSDAQGDFARTSDQMANTQRSLKAELENVTIELGERMIPFMLDLVTFIKDDGIPAIESFMDALDNLGNRESAQGTPFEGIEKAFNDFADSGLMVRDFITGEGDKIREVVDRVGGDFWDLRQQVKDAMNALGLDFDEALELVETRAGQHDIPQAFSTQMYAGMESEGQGIADAISGPVADGADQAVDEVENMYTEIARTIKEKEDSLRQAGGDAVQAWLDPQLTTYDIARVEAELASEDLRTNLASKDPDIKRDAEQRRLELTAELISLKNEQATQGEQTAQIAHTKALLTSDFMQQGLASKDPEIRELFRGWRLAAETHLSTLGESAYPWGYQIGDELARGMWDSKQLISDAAYALANTASRQIRIESEPPDHNSPLYGITKWGGNIVKTIADGIYAELGTTSGAAHALSSSLVPSFSAPAMAGATVPAHAGFGPTYIVNVNGVQRTVKTAEEAMQVLEDLGAFSEGRLS